MKKLDYKKDEIEIQIIIRVSEVINEFWSVTGQKRLKGAIFIFLMALCSEIIKWIFHSLVLI